ncbi:putative outer membrane adhesin-like protein [Psychromonas ingrahamii 37]|uniref:Putative outer membrane adhesin-like protein n=1 Tax=Psychromonas ingrahamii (strain DSM 17664 / CCUG 51855 / 37) TaxID=357804 RepID=A1SZF5_PSYIN|nr:VCBS domain-containing protein [Psychromonas ingrahamii]ABM04870.1 putative outer membrane adhesin-like protein [Psychromonas ingrahamii 37]
MKKQSINTSIRFRRKPLIMALEPRILLDGAALATTVEMATDVAYQNDAAQQETSDQSIHFAAPAPTEVNNRREVAFVDTQVEDYQSLVNGLGDNIEVILINSDHSGLDQMVSALRGQSEIDAIHLYSHGDIGELKIGNQTLTSDNLQANSELLSRLGQSLSESGDIMLYGCYVGADSEGQSFIDTIAELSGADVAASNDLTGAQNLGGDWDLEADNGTIETLALLSSEFNNVLGAPATTVSQLADAFSFAEGGAPVTVDSSISFSGGGSYTEGYIRFSVASATADDFFTLKGAANVNDNGAISIEGSDVYQGNGSSRDRIGSIDAVENGENGQALKILFSSPLPNSGFEEGTADWTIVDAEYGNGGDEINFDNYTIPLATNSDDNSTYTGGTGTVNVQTPNGMNFNGSIASTAGVDSTKALYLNSDGHILRSDQDSRGSFQTDGYGSIHGPYARSSVIGVENGDSISLEFNAQGIGDDYEVFGLLRKVDGNGDFISNNLDANNIVLFAERGADTSGYKTVTYSGLSAGDYRFEFVGGTYDGTGGLVVGSNLYVDNIRLISSASVTDSVASQIASQVQYQSTSGGTETARNVTVTAVNQSGTSGSDTIILNITLSNNAPSFSAPGVLDTVNEDSTSPSGATVSSLFDSLFDDPDVTAAPIDSLTGVVITADNSTSAEGAWQYSTDSGANWYAVGSVSDASGLVLSSASNLRFVPVADYNGTPGGLSVHAIDSSDNSINYTAGITRASYDVALAGNTGGITAVSSSAVALTTSIAAVNDDSVVTAVDVDGSIIDGTRLNDSGSIAFTDADLTDRPTANEVIKLVTAIRADGSTPLGLTDTQQAAIEAAFSLTPAVANGNDGSINWDYTIAVADLDFLAKDEVVTAVFTVTVNDGHGGLVAQDVTVTLTGSNDLPLVIATDVNGSIIDGTRLNDSGSIAFTDADLTDRPTANEVIKSVTAIRADGSTPLGLTDTQQAAIEAAFSLTPAVGNGNDGSINWDYTIAAADLDFLAKDEVVTAVFTVTVNDGHGGLVAQDVTVTLTGKNDVPLVIATDVNGSIIDGTRLNDSGSIAFTDADLTDRPTANEVTKSVTAIRADGSTPLGLTDTQQAAIEAAFSLTPAVANGNDGSINWDYTIAVADLDFLAKDEVVTAVFTVTVNDGHGGLVAQDVTVTLTGSNDLPLVIATDVNGSIIDGTRLNDSGSIAFTDVDLTDRPTANEVTKSVTAIRADGSTPLGLTDTQQAAIEAAFSLTPAVANGNDGSINWDYTIAVADLDFLAKDEVVTAVFTVTVNDGHGGLVAQDVTVTLTGSNDLPLVIATDVNGSIIDGTRLNDSGSIAFTDADLTDRPTANEVIKSVTAIRADGSTPLGLTDTQQAAIEAAFSLTPAVGNGNDGSINWDYTIAAADLDFLAKDEVVTAVFTVTVNDGHGGLVAQDVTVTLTGKNDVPLVIATDVNGSIIDGTRLNDSGSIAFTDADLTDRPTANEVTKSVTAIRADGSTPLGLTDTQQAAIEAAFSLTPAVGNGNDGSINWDYTIAAADLDFLAKDEVVTAVFTVTVNDGHGGLVAQDVTVTLTGKNDVPLVIATDVNGSIIDGTRLNDSGSIAFTDADLTDRPTANEVTKSVTAIRADGSTPLGLTDTQQAAIEAAFSLTPAVANGNDGSINWDYTIAVADLDFLAKDEVVTAVFTVTVNDGHGGLVAQDVTVTLTGSNDLPLVIATDVNGSIIDGTRLNDSGSIAFTDVDLTDRPTANEVTKSVTAIRADGSTPLGLTDTQQAAIEAAFSLTPAVANGNDGSINWDYTIAVADLDFLAKDEVVTAVFTVTVNDGHGGLVAQDVTVTLTGSNDLPLVIATDVNGSIIDGTRLNDSGSIAFTDVDLTDRPTANEVTKSVTAIRADGSTPLGLTDTQQAAIEAAFSLTPAVANGNDGSINWDYTIAVADLDFLAKDEVVTAVFTVTVNDGHGGLVAQDVTVTLTGSNDLPLVIATDVNGSIIDGTRLNDSGSIAFTDVDLTDRPTANEVTKSVTAIRADGSTPLGLTDTQQAAIEAAFSLTPAVANGNDGSINWDYTIAVADLDFLAKDEVVTAVFTVTVNDGHGGLVAQDVTVTLTGSNDLPLVIATDVNGSIIDGTRLNDSGSIAFTDADLTDRPTANEVIKSVTAIRADGSTPLGLTDTQQAAIEAAFSLTPAVGNGNDGSINWDYTIAAADLDFLAKDEVVTAVFTVTVNDGHGGLVAQDVTVTLTGKNDVPLVIATDVNGSIIDGTRLNDSGSIAFTDADLTDRPTANEVTKSVTAIRADGSTPLGLTDTQQAAIEAAFSLTPAVANGNDGSINWDYTIAVADLDFLAKDEVVTAVFTVTVNDGHGGLVAQDVTVTLTGSNDLPLVIATDVNGSIIDGTRLNDSGSIAFTDVDLTDRPTANEVTKSVTAIRADGSTPLGLTDTQQAAIEAAFSLTPAVANGNDGSINWDYTIAVADLEFLAKDEVVTAVFTVTVNDGHGGLVAQDVTVTLTGSNDLPLVIATDVNGSIIDGTRLNDSGSIAFTDVDLTDRPTANEVIKSVTAIRADGSTPLGLTDTQQAAIEAAFSLTPAVGNGNDGSINWDYTIAAADLDFLAKDEVVTAVFTVTVNDGHGGLVAQDVTMTLTGSNDVPTITADAASGISELTDASAQALSDSGTVSFTDIDNTDLIDITFESNNDIAWSNGTLDDVLATALVTGFGVGINDSAAPGNTEWSYDVSGHNLDFLSAGDTVNFSYTVTATDSQGAIATDTVEFIITGTNDIPEVTSRQLTDNETVIQMGDDYLLDISSLFSDKDSGDSFDNLELLIAGLPVGVSYNAETGIISGAPREPGKFIIVLTAFDTEGASVTRSFELTVTAVVQDDGVATGGDSTPPPAPENDTQSVESGFSAVPDGLVNNGGSSDPSGTGGFMGNKTLAGDAEPINEGTAADQATEQVILAEGGVLVVENQSQDGRTSISSSVDVTVSDSGEVIFNDVQQGAFSFVSLAVVVIENVADNELFIDIADTSQNSSKNYTGTLGSGEGLPGWVTLDPTTGSITINNPPLDQKEVTIRIETVDADNNKRVLELKLNLDELLKRQQINAESDLNENNQAQTEFLPLNGQMEAELLARDQYGDNLMALLHSA